MRSSDARSHRLPSSSAWTALLISAGLIVPSQQSAAALREFLGYGPLYDPSTRSVGMASSTVAVFWGGDPNSWANPALLGYARGMQFEHSTSSRSALPDGSERRLDRLTVWAAGIGVTVAGEPFDGLGRHDYFLARVRTAFEPEGVGFTITDEARSWAVGGNVIEAGSHALRALGLSVPDVSRFVDLSFGFGEKRFRRVFDPSSASGAVNGFEDEAGYGRDFGRLLRITPYDSIDHPSVWSDLDRALGVVGGLRLEAAYGDATLNEKLSARNLEGWAVRGALGLPAPVRSAIDRGSVGRLFAASLSPGLAVARSWTRPLSAFRQAQWSGWEVCVANVFTWRRGRIDELAGGQDSDTSGWSLGLQLVGLGGFRYDHATSRVSYDSMGGAPIEYEHAGFRAFLEPIAIWHSLRRP